ASLADQQAARGVARELLAALDQRRVYGSRADEQVTPAGLQARVELLETHEDRAHLRDRVDAEVRSRAMSGDAVRLDLESDGSLVRAGQLQLVRLAHGGGVCAHVLEHGNRPEGSELLVGPRREDDVAGELELSRTNGRLHDRGDRALHVVGA